MGNEYSNVVKMPRVARKKKRRRKTKRSQGSVYQRNLRWYAKVRVTDRATGLRSGVRSRLRAQPIARRPRSHWML